MDERTDGMMAIRTHSMPFVFDGKRGKVLAHRDTVCDLPRIVYSYGYCLS